MQLSFVAMNPLFNEFAQPRGTGGMAGVLEVKTTGLGPMHAKLISKGVVFSPAHRDMAFTVSLFNDFKKRDGWSC